MHNRNINTVVNKKYVAIDYLRALAIIMVIIFHASGYAYGQSLINSTYVIAYFKLSILCASGVTLFFVISGFLITGILLDTQNQKNTLKKFYIRRALRIFPLYYVSIIIISVILFLIFDDFKLNIQILSHLLYASNFLWIVMPEGYEIFSKNHTGFYEHFWSLAIEEQFYLIWPAIILFIQRKMQPTKFCALIISLIIFSFSLRLYMIFAGNLNWEIVYTFTPCRFDGLLLGAILACVLHYNIEKFKHILDTARNYILFVPLAMFYIALMMLQHTDIFIVNVVAFLPLEAIFFALLLWKLIDKNTPITNKILSGFLLNTAKYSYCIYIIHIPIMQIIKLYVISADTSFWINHGILLTAFPISYAIASISYRYFERPLLKLKDKYAPYEKPQN